MMTTCATLLNLPGFPNPAARRPHELSSGQQQRVAIGRAMVTLSAMVFLVGPKLSVAAVTVVRLDQAGKSTQAAAFSACVILVVLAGDGGLAGLARGWRRANATHKESHHANTARQR